MKINILTFIILVFLFQTTFAQTYEVGIEGKNRPQKTLPAYNPQNIKLLQGKWIESEPSEGDKGEVWIIQDKNVTMEGFLNDGGKIKPEKGKIYLAIPDIDTKKKAMMHLVAEISETKLIIEYKGWQTIFVRKND